MEEWSKFIEILEASVKKNGKYYPITLGHLLAIAKIVDEQSGNDNWPEADVGDMF